MQKLLLLTLLMCVTVLTYGQDIRSHLITSTGTSIMGAEGGMYISVGEPLSTEIQEGDIMIAQGFLQVTTSNTTVDTDNLLTETIEVYPNPTSADLIVTIPESQGTYLVQVYGSDGSVIKSDKIIGIKNTIDLSQFPEGAYFMNVIKEDKQSETLKIFKIK